jgi:hypothetical protein
MHMLMYHGNDDLMDMMIWGLSGGHLEFIWRASGWLWNLSDRQC